MLINFFVSNFLSFGKEVKFSMLPSPRLEQHREKHIYSGNNSEDFKILRGALIYGGNGSGKSNFIKAIRYASDCVLNEKNMKEGDLFDIPQHKAFIDKSTKFEFDIKTYSGYYNYGFQITKEKVLEEWLYRIFPNREDVELFYRRDQEPLSLGSMPDDVRNFIQNTRVRDNQLLLNKLLDDGIAKEKFQEREYFLSVYMWFKGLVYISPKARHKSLVRDVSSNQQIYDEVIKNTISPDSSVSVISEDVEDALIKDVPPEQLEALDKNAILLGKNDASEMLVKQNGKIVKSRIIVNEGGVGFDFNELSDGTRRLFNLVPLLQWSKEKDVPPFTILIDEIDSSLHPLLSAAFINKFFNGEGNVAPVQFICTTHEVELLDLDYIRKDEVWFTEKVNGETVMSSLSEYEGVRFDTRIRNAYMVGRYSGIPFIRCPNGW